MWSRKQLERQREKRQLHKVQILKILFIASDKEEDKKTDISRNMASDTQDDYLPRLPQVSE